MTFKIEKNIPAPVGQRSTEITETVSKMKLGDSVLIENNSQYQSFFHAIKRSGRSCRSRREGSKRRVWIVEKKATTKPSIYDRQPNK